VRKTAGKVQAAILWHFNLPEQVLNFQNNNNNNNNKAVPLHAMKRFGGEEV
jgi:hypothetical protein